MVLPIICIRQCLVAQPGPAVPVPAVVVPAPLVPSPAPLSAATTDVGALVAAVAAIVAAPVAAVAAPVATVAVVAAAPEKQPATASRFGRKRKAPKVHQAAWVSHAQEIVNASMNKL